MRGGENFKGRAKELVMTNGSRSLKEPQRDNREEGRGVGMGPAGVGVLLVLLLLLSPPPFPSEPTEQAGMEERGGFGFCDSLPYSQKEAMDAFKVSRREEVPLPKGSLFTDETE